MENVCVCVCTQVEVHRRRGGFFCIFSQREVEISKCKKKSLGGKSHHKEFQSRDWFRFPLKKLEGKGGPLGIGLLPEWDFFFHGKKNGGNNGVFVRNCRAAAAAEGWWWLAGVFIAGRWNATPGPNHQGWYAKRKLSQNMYTMHIRFCTYSADLYAQSVLINKISWIGPKSEAY